MATFRIQKDKENPYVMINKQCLNDNKLSAKAKGILAYLLSLPDDWQIYESEISTHFSDGIKSIGSGIRELIKCGYIVREQNRNKGKFGSYEYCVYEVSTGSPLKANGEKESVKKENGKRHTTNTDLTNTNLTNNKNSNIYTILPDDDIVLSFYDKYLFLKTGKHHKKIKVSDLEVLDDWVNLLAREEIKVSDYKESVKDYIDNLNDKNDGGILAFIKTGKRYFDIDVVNELNL